MRDKKLSINQIWPEVSMEKHFIFENGPYLVYLVPVKKDCKDIWFVPIFENRQIEIWMHEWAKTKVSRGIL